MKEATAKKVTTRKAIAMSDKRNLEERMEIMQDQLNHLMDTVNILSSLMQTMQMQISGSISVPSRQTEPYSSQPYYPYEVWYMHPGTMVDGVYDS